ncbi:hypothetical protein GCM10009716_27650 [Streptomyces sodiiphilus]|uniref:Uncharacterized protein n=1 Tax=Streptomyces sodiiphilus TaxID=226217 RepID=A0ABN2PEN2_9ACTN
MIRTRQFAVTAAGSLFSAAALGAVLITGLPAVGAATGQSAAGGGSAVLTTECPRDTHWIAELGKCVEDTHW